MESRTKERLPYRENCEGYFLYNNNEVVAQDTGKGFVIFPGGGVDKNETPLEAIKRETFEETGAVFEGSIREIKVIYFDWDREWAKTKKQKERYSKFRGEEMHFFIGRVKEFTKPVGDLSDEWIGKKTMLIDDAIRLINKDRPFSEDLEGYRKIQLDSLKLLKEGSFGFE